MDVITPICNAQQPNCVAIVPHVAALIAAARKAGALVVYSAAAPNGLVAPVTAAAVSGRRSRRRTATRSCWVRAKTASTRPRSIGCCAGTASRPLILAGWRENGSVLYTAVGANLHNYTAVVAEDATSATTDYDIAIGRYQLLTQLNNNAKNEPLKKGAVTLSRGDLITFR